MTNTARQNLLAKTVQDKRQMRKGKAITNDPATAQAKDRIRQIIGEQGYHVGFPGWPERVELRIDDGKGMKTRSLGKLADVAQLGEAALVSLALTRISEEGKSCSKGH